MVGPLSYIGGKNRLAKTIIAMLPEHITYVEPFAGGAQVLFHKPPSNVEVLNDLDFDIVNFFRVCQWHYEELVRCPTSQNPTPTTPTCTTAAAHAGHGDESGRIRIRNTIGSR